MADRSPGSSITGVEQWLLVVPLLVLIQGYPSVILMQGFTSSGIRTVHGGKATGSETTEDKRTKTARSFHSHRTQVITTLLFCNLASFIAAKTTSWCCARANKLFQHVTQISKADPRMEDPHCLTPGPDRPRLKFHCCNNLCPSKRDLRDQLVGIISLRFPPSILPFCCSQMTHPSALCLLWSQNSTPLVVLRSEPPLPTPRREVVVRRRLRT